MSLLYVSGRKMSRMLLVLILLRLIPFNLLHYHNGVFAGFQTAIIADAGEELLAENTGTCGFHQFLDLINHGFFFTSSIEVTAPVGYRANLVHYLEEKSQVYFIYILNKGSPDLC